MRIVTFSKIKEFTEKQASSDVALRDWYFKAKRSEWNTLNDIKQTFNSVDYVGNNRYVFNIKGNDYRLLLLLSFLLQTKCIFDLLVHIPNMTK